MLLSHGVYYINNKMSLKFQTHSNEPMSDTPLWRRTTAWMLAALACLILFIAATYHLRESPAIWYDEGYYTQAAMNLSEIGHQALQLAPGRYISTAFVTVGYPLIYPVSVFYHLFGAGVAEGRAVMVLFIFGFAAVSYALVRKLFGGWTAAWTLLYLSSFPMLYGNGKSVLGEVPGLFYLVLALLALWYLERTQYRNWRGYAVLGVAAGLCAVTKPIFILFLAALFLTLVIRWRRTPLQWSGSVLGLVALGLPVLMWLYLQFGFGDSWHSVVSAYANPYAVEDLTSVILQNALRFFTESTPIYTMILMAVWGASLALKRRYKDASSAELAAFIFCVLIILAYLRLEGWYRYFFPATMTALLFFPYACSTVFNYIAERLRFLRRVPWLRYLFIIALIAAQLYQLARTSYVADYYHSTRTRDLTAQIESFGPEASFFLYNTPEVAVLLPSRNYYQYLEPSGHLNFGADEVSVLQKGTADVVIVYDNTYRQREKLFSKYTLAESVNRYDFLKRRQ